MNGIGRFTFYLVMAFQYLVNGHVPEIRGSILELLNPHGVSSFYQMEIDFWSTVIDLLKKIYIMNEFQTVL